MCVVFFNAFCFFSLFLRKNRFGGWRSVMFFVGLGLGFVQFYRFCEVVYKTYLIFWTTQQRRVSGLMF